MDTVEDAGTSKNKMASRLRQYCSVFGCLLNSKDKPELSFFAVPKEPDKRLQWLQLISREDMIDKKTRTLVCETHFHPNDIVKNDRKRIVKGKVPTLNLPTKTKNNVQTQTDTACTFSKNAATQTGHSMKGTSKENTFRREDFSGDFLQKIKSEPDPHLTSQKRFRKFKLATSKVDIFHKLCDRFLSKSLADLVKAETNLKSRRKENRNTIIMPRKYNRKPGAKARLISWTDQELEAAFKEIEKNEIGINEISRRYNIPSRTLRRRYANKNKSQLTLGKHPVLGYENEKILVALILKLEEAGFPPTRQNIRRLAYQFAEKLQIKHNFDHKKQMAGKDWFQSFIERSPVLAIRQTEGLSVARDKELNREEVNNFNELLTKVMTENGLLDKPERIYNMDEYGIQLNNNPGRQGIGRGPRSLVFLCEKAVKKYKLSPEPKKFTAPETFSVVGGKPLRKRSAKPPPELEVKKEKKAKKGKNPKTLAVLCQNVIKEYNLLPQCEETEQPSSNQLLIKKNTPTRKRGRPLKSEQEKKIKSTKSRGRPRKDQTISNEFGEASTSYSSFLEQSQDIRKIKVEQDLFLDQPPEDDPLRNDEDEFTVVIKEERLDVEPEEYTRHVTVEVPQATALGIVINPMAQVEIPGPGVSVVAKTMTVVMDEYQIFANSIAEQLRALPPNRALLLQFDIQSMVDNEKQLMGHES